MSEPLSGARTLIERAHSIDIIGHIRPDGDAVGSVLGLSLSLLDSNKEARPVLADGIPDRFAFLPGADLAKTSLTPDADLWIVVDTASLDRTGFDDQFGIRQPDINIDHHPTNTRFAKINLVDDSAAATAQILHYDLEPLGLRNSQPIATNLLGGILTDTLGFRTSNVSPETLHAASILFDLGADLNNLYKKLLIEHTFEAARYWGAGLSNLVREGRLIWTQLHLQDRQNAKYPANDDAELINWLSSLEQTDVVVLFIEQPDKQTKVSWRSNKHVDVSLVASSFGGGGHKAASGAMIRGAIGEVIEDVLAKTRLQMAADDG